MSLAELTGKQVQHQLDVADLHNDIEFYNRCFDELQKRNDLIDAQIAIEENDF